MKTKLKVLSCCIFALFVSQSALSSTYRNCRPVYLGLELGAGNLHYKNTKLAHNSVVDDSGLAGRLIAGFDINPNLGLELGYTIYQNPEFKQRDAVTDFSQQSLDFLAKVSLPMTCNLSFYAKGGLSWVHRDDAQIKTNDVIILINKGDDHLRPMLGVGMDYAFNPRVSANIGYYRTFGTDDLEDADFYGAGVTFRVG